MPKEGFTTITIADRYYDHMMQWYKESKEIGVLPGDIVSFTSFFVWKMQEATTQHFAMRKFISKITYVPDKFTFNKLQIKQS
jgi:hypothetical protein